MCKVIAVAMQKGGCAKTSVSLNLGIGLGWDNIVVRWYCHM